MAYYMTVYWLQSRFLECLYLNIPFGQVYIKSTLFYVSQVTEFLPKISCPVDSMYDSSNVGYPYTPSTVNRSSKMNYSNFTKMRGCRVTFPIIFKWKLKRQNHLKKTKTFCTIIQ